jgi:hypothetical protein
MLHGLHASSATLQDRICVLDLTEKSHGDHCIPQLNALDYVLSNPRAARVQRHDGLAAGPVPVSARRAPAAAVIRRNTCDPAR